MSLEAAVLEILNCDCTKTAQEISHELDVEVDRIVAVLKRLEQSGLLITE